MNITNSDQLQNLLCSADYNKPFQLFIDLDHNKLLGTHNCLAGRLARIYSHRNIIIFPILAPTGDWYGPNNARDIVYINQLVDHINSIYSQKEIYQYQPNRANYAPWLP